MANEIDCSKIFIKDLFGTEWWFRIPEYQRPYVWEKDQVHELLDDIMTACINNKESQYFLGSLVIQSNKKNENGIEFTESDLLDGQQRITTLFILAAVIRDIVISNKIDDTHLIDSCNKSIYQAENKFDDVPERMRIVFDIRENVKEFIDEFIKPDGGTLKINELNRIIQNSDGATSVHNMAKAILTMHEYFSDKVNAVTDFFLFLRTKVLMIYVATEKLDDAFQLFTVMNNRGVKLRNSDILKAQNLRELETDVERKKWAEKWETIESYFGENFDNFLSHIRTIIVKRRATVNLLKEYEEKIYAPVEFDRTTKTTRELPPLLKKGQETFECIERFYKIYLKLFDESINLSGDYEFYNYISLMRKGYEADYWVAPLMAYYNKFNEYRLLEFVKALDKKFSTDWIVGEMVTKRVDNINAILQDIDKINNADEVFEMESLNIDYDNLKAVLNLDLYGRKYTKYILLKLDMIYHGHTDKFSISDVVSVEHILPQNPLAESKWCMDFSEQQRKEWTNKLGNLVLISRRKNASQGNLEYSEKKSKYFHNNIELFSNSVRVYQNYATWTLSDLRGNHEIVLEKLLDYYK